MTEQPGADPARPDGPDASGPDAGGPDASGPEASDAEVPGAEVPDAGGSDAGVTVRTLDAAVRQTARDRPRTAAAVASDAALDRYRTSMRRKNGRYFTLLGVLVAVVAVIVGVAWSRGEVAHTTLHTVSSRPANLPVETASANPTIAWQSSDSLAIGTPQAGGTVVTYSAHTVRGRDVRTGKQTWSYTRSDRTVCTAAQLSNSPNPPTTIAVYRLHGNCDEVTALNSETGKRRWTRTLDMNGMPVDGEPAFQSTPYTLMATTADVVYALDPETGYNRWTYQRNSCRIENAVLGTGGVLISQDCTEHVQCPTNLKYCGKGQQLFLRDASAGTLDSSKNNPDQIKWIRFGDVGLPASADQLFSVVDPSGRQFDVLDSSSGRTIRTVPLASPVSTTTVPVAVPTSSSELIWTSGQLTSINLVAGGDGWSVPTSGPATVVALDGSAPPSLTAARVTTTRGAAVESLDGTTGNVVHRYPVEAPLAGRPTYPLGTGFLVAVPGGVVAYR